MKKIYNFLKLKDISYVFNEDISDNITYATMCYIGPLFIISILFNIHKKSKYMLFHVNQGFNLFLIEVFVFLVLGLFNNIFCSTINTTPIFISLINFIFYLLIVILMLCCIVNTINGKSIKMPIIGVKRFIK